MALACEKPPYLFTVCEYLTFEHTAEERHEYLDGVMYAMAESRNHGHKYQTKSFLTQCRYNTSSTSNRFSQCISHDLMR